MAHKTEFISNIFFVILDTLFIESTRMRKLNLDNLKLGQPGLSKIMASFLVEATIVCLSLNGHQSGVVLKVTGDVEEDFQLFWSDKITLQKISTWKDKNEATEYGASAIAILLIFVLEGLVIKERLPQNDTADYSLRTVQSAQQKGQLEVSGIWKEAKGNTNKTRVRIKLNRLSKNPSIPHLPIYVIVTEFGSPKSKIKKHEK